VLCKKGLDEVVKVGGFWIDRYEASVWSNRDCTGTQYGASGDDYGTGFPGNGNWTTKRYACSKNGVMPARHVTWFQAVQACELSGKHLCTNEEWQAAAAGTHDPGASGTGTQCLVSGAAPRNTGLAGTTPAATTTCVSRYGAQDMIGNLFERVTLWGQAGLTYLTASSGIFAKPWPESYGDDAVVNLNSSVFVTESTATNGAPAAAVRGGGYASGTNAGLFNIAMNTAPSYSSERDGLRCCLSY
jgi:formylglycine-generating enzyme required for sulfatase activity